MTNALKSCFSGKASVATHGSQLANAQTSRRNFAEQLGIDPTLGGVGLGLLPRVVKEYLEEWSACSQFERVPTASDAICG